MSLKLGIRAAFCNHFLQIFQTTFLVGKCNFVACPSNLIEQANRHCIDFADRNRGGIAGDSTELFCICNQFCPLWLAQHLRRFGKAIQQSLIVCVRGQLYRLCYQGVGIERSVFVSTRQNPLTFS